MCVFCNIVNKTQFSYKIYENEFIIAFLDLHPISVGHTLIIPKKHFTNHLDADFAINKEFFFAINKIISLLKNKFKAIGFNITTNVGASAGQIIFHYHWHVIPHYNDTNHNWRVPRLKLSDDEFKQIQKKFLS